MANLKVRRYEWLALGLTLVQFLLLVGGLRKVYLTADEPAYIAGGYALVARGKEALALLSQRGYPPLLAALEALFVYIGDPHVPVAQLAGWPANYDVFMRSFEPYMAPVERTLFAARMPTVWLTVLLGAVVYRWAKSLWGAVAGVLALWILVFDPSLLAHGRLAHSDAGVVAWGTASLYAAWRWARTARLRWALISGGLLGLTMLSKVSGLLWVVAAAVCILVTLLQCRRTRQRIRALAQGLLVLGVSGGVFWGGYAFTWGPVRGFGLPLPAPAYWESGLYLSRYTSVVFALGRRWYEHVWWYYPLGFLIKNPLLLLLGLSLGVASLAQRPFSLPRAVVLWFFPALYTMAALLMGMNIGYRHMLPIHPYIYLTIGGGMEPWSREGRSWRRWILIAGCLVYAAGTVRLSPYELSFFNSLVGGPKRGYLYLADSNVDWGQTPPEVVNAFVQAHPGMQSFPPAAPFRPSAGSYLVSAAHLQGAGIGDPLAYEWFRHREPTTSLNYALLMYDVPPFDLTWVAQCESPVPPLATHTIIERTGKRDLRLLGFDCGQTWVYPAGGREAGIYALHYDLFWPPRLQFPSLLFGPPMPRAPFVGRQLTGARLSFEKTHADDMPTFVLYETDSPPTIPPYPKTGGIAPAEMPPVEARNLGLWREAVSLDHRLVFLGMTLNTADDAWEIETWWQADAVPVSRPFSIMAQLISADGYTLSVGDGLGVSPLALQSGDILVQRHRFSKPPEGQGYWLRTGAYWLDTLERWNIDGAVGADALFIALAH